MVIKYTICAFCSYTIGNFFFLISFLDINAIINNWRAIYKLL